MLGQEHRFSDLTVGLTFGDEVKDSLLLGSERLELRVGLRWTRDSFDDSGHDPRVHQAFTRRDAMHVVDQIARLYLLEHIAGRSSHHTGEDRLIVGEAREHQTDQIGHHRPCVAADLDATASLEAYVEKGDVGLRQGDALQGLDRRSRLADDLYVLVRLQEQPDPLADQLMVIEEKHADRHSAIVPAPAPLPLTFGFWPYLASLALSTITAVPYHRIGDPEKLGRLMDSMLMIEADIELPLLLGHLVEEARTLVDARYAALGVLNESRTSLEQFLTVGLSEQEERAIGPRPTGRGVLGRLITDPAPLRLRELGAHDSSYGFPANHPPMKSFLGVPIRARGEVFGNLYLTDKVGAEDFTEEDEALSEALALAAGIAIDNTRLHDRVRTMSVLDDRERIGRDLHDKVVQRLFAVGMALQGAARMPDLNLVRERIDKVVDDLDATINEIRTTIFELGDSALPGGLRQAVVGLADELAPTVGVRPDLTFEGAIDNAIPQQTADHLLSVLREMLSNVGKHAQATRVLVILTVGDDVVLEVVDNGVGFAPPADGGGLGLSNLRGRAEKLGGTFDVRVVQGGGTKATWRVPI